MIQTDDNWNRTLNGFGFFHFGVHRTIVSSRIRWNFHESGSPPFRVGEIDLSHTGAEHDSGGMGRADVIDIGHGTT